MPDEVWKIRGNEDAFARLTGIGLLIEVASVGILALFASFGDDLSRAEGLATAFVITFGIPVGFLLLFIPRALAGALPGRLLLALVAIAQLGLLAVLAVQISDYADPGLGVQAGVIVFDFLAAAYAVVLLSGTLRTLAGPGPNSAGLKRGRSAARAALLVAALCVVFAGVTAFAGAAGMRCKTFRFDSHRWATGGANADGSVTDRERMADTLVDCGTLTRKTRSDLAAMLGPGKPHGPRQNFYVGSVNDALGPGDAQYLIVRYAGNRVRRAVLAPPNSD